MTDYQKITVTVPKALLERLDALLPVRRRSDFIADAIQAQLAQLEQAAAIDEAAGAWTDADYPELSDDAAIDAWLADLRTGWQREPA